jgi:hypothetical protein
MPEINKAGGSGKRHQVRWILSILALVMILFLFYFYRSPMSVIRVYLNLTQRINIGDGGLLSRLPCASPCAFGIQAGQTRWEQVLPLLEKNGISKCQTETSVSWVLVSCGLGRFNVQADAQTKIMNGIWFNPNTSISVGEIIAQYGEPDFVSLDFERYLEEPTTQMNLYWDSIRMLVTLPETGGGIYVIKKATKIKGVDFSDENLYQSSTEVEFGSFYQLWNGFGAYQP